MLSVNNVKGVKERDSQAKQLDILPAQQASERSFQFHINIFVPRKKENLHSIQKLLQFYMLPEKEHTSPKLLTFYKRSNLLTQIRSYDAVPSLPINSFCQKALHI